MSTPIKERILDTSLALFNERGYHHVTTNHIAEELGKSPATIYYYYGNKEAIVRALLPRIATEWHAVGLHPAAGAPGLDFADVLAFMRGFMDTIWRYRFFSINAVYLKDQDPELAAMHDQLRHAGRRLIHILLLAIRESTEANTAARHHSNAEDEAFVTNVELILDNWIRHLQLNEPGEMSREKLDRGILQVLAMLLPWLSEDWQASIRQWLERGTLPAELISDTVVETLSRSAS
jgi:AcrR family transcriptional regulator